MLLKNTLKAATAISLLAATGAYADTLTIATVNNGDMIRMQGLTDDFTAKTGHNVEWVTLEENVLRQRVTTDITTKGGAFDIMTIGMYETPIWGANGWLVPLDDLSADYNVGDILPAMAGGLSHEGRHPMKAKKRSSLDESGNLDNHLGKSILLHCGIY